MVTLLRLAACSVPASQFQHGHRVFAPLLRFAVFVFRALLVLSPFPALRASDIRKLTRGAPCSLGSSAAIAATGCRLFAPRWAYFALLRSQFTMSRLAAPNGLQRSLFIGLPLRLFRALRAAKLRPTGRALRAPRHCRPQFAMVVRIFCTALAFGGAVFNSSCLRFASCARHSSPQASDVRPSLARGLTTAHSAGSGLQMRYRVR